MGDTGSTVVEESQTLGDEVEFTEGLTIDRGFLSPYFINDQERSLCEMKKPKVGVSDFRPDTAISFCLLPPPLHVHVYSILL